MHGFPVHPRAGAVRSCAQPQFARATLDTERAQHLVWLRWEQPQAALRMLDAIIASGRVAGFEAGEMPFVRGSAFLRLRDQHRAWWAFHDQMVADEDINQEKSPPVSWKFMVRRRQAEEAERFLQQHVAAAVSFSEFRLWAAIANYSKCCWTVARSQRP